MTAYSDPRSSKSAPNHPHQQATTDVLEKKMTDQTVPEAPHAGLIGRLRARSDWAAMTEAADILAVLPLHDAEAKAQALEEAATEWRNPNDLTTYAAGYFLTARAAAIRGQAS